LIAGVGFGTCASSPASTIVEIGMVIT